MKLTRLFLSFVAAGCLSLGAASAQCINAYEPNNSTSQYTSLSANTTISAGIGYNGDQDYYRIYIGSSNYINVELSNLPADFDVALLNSSGATVASSTRGSNLNEGITYYGSAGYYYVRVYGYAGAFSTTQCYSLRTSTGCIRNYEPNNSTSYARYISTNTSYAAGISPQGDEDYYTFTTSSPNTYIELTLTNLPADYDIHLLNSSGTVLATGVLGGTSSETVRYNTAAAGTYYVRVFGYSGANSASQCYVLRANVRNYAYARPSSDSQEKVLDAAVAEGMSFYPNPAVSGSEVNVNIASEAEVVTLKVLDMKGQLVSTQTLAVSEGQAKLNLAGVEPGMYMIDAGNGSVSKIVVE